MKTTQARKRQQAQTENQLRIKAVHGRFPKAGDVFCAPYRLDSVELLRMGPDGYGDQAVGSIYAGDADPAGLWNAAGFAHTKEMVDLLLRVREELTTGDLNPDALLEDAVRILDRVERTARGLIRLAKQDKADGRM